MNPVKLAEQFLAEFRKTNQLLAELIAELRKGRANV